MKRFLTICAVLLSLIMVVPAASAASGADCLTVAAAVRGEEIISAAPAIIFNNNGNCNVFSGISVLDSNADYYVVSLGDDIAEINFLENDEENGIAIFQADESLLSDPHVLNLAQSFQAGEGLNYYFYISDSQGNLSVQEGALTVDQDGYVNIDLPNGVEKSDILFPSVALNQAGELAIICTEQGFVPTCDFDAGSPSSSPSTSQKPSPSSSAPGKGDSIKGRIIDPGAEPELSLGVIIGIVAVAAVVVAAVILLLVLKRKKPAPTPTPPTPTPPTPVPPVPPTEAVPDIEINPVVIKPQPRPKSSVLYLCCEGGALDGRRYPVGTTTLVIGRNPDCNICYPNDTKGVSRRHCEIFWKNGVLNIMDLGSTSGTFIRGKGQITANVPVAINAGDTFYLGEKRNAFVIRMEG